MLTIWLAGFTTYAATVSVFQSPNHAKEYALQGQCQQNIDTAEKLKKKYVWKALNHYFCAFITSTIFLCIYQVCEYDKYLEISSRQMLFEIYIIRRQ